MPCLLFARPRYAGIAGAADLPARSVVPTPALESSLEMSTYRIKLVIEDTQANPVFTAEFLADPASVKSPELATVDLRGVAEFLMEQTLRAQGIGNRPID